MSANSHKSTPKMCKSPKNTNFHIKPEKIQIINDYENLSTNCTVIGSNNLHLVKKPQMVTSMSPAYSNPSPGYPQSPYSSPVSMKSPSPQSMKPPTPQPSYPVMQIFHNSQLLARPVQSQQQSVIKLKPHLNILPKPSASPQPSPKPSVSPHIVIPAPQQTATIMPTAQPLLINQMPMLAPGVQLILRPQTTKLPSHVQTATPQGLILQPSGQQLLQLQPSRTSQPMVRVLTNGVQLAQPTQVMTQVTNPAVSQSITHHHAQILQNSSPISISHHNSMDAFSPRKKCKKKKQKLDLANIMKLSGIGDEDDIQFESDTSQSESEPNIVQSQPNIVHMHQNVIHHEPSVIRSQANVIQSHSNVIHSTEASKRIGNIHISAVGPPTLSTAPTPLVQLLNQSFQSGVNSTSFQATSQASGIPLNSFITPNITINNGLVVQRNGGFKLALGEDGRLVLQHDPTLNQDLQSQLLLQSIFGLNGLVLQPSIDQQVHSQTVQTIQQQSVQTIQQQTVQSQTIQTVQQQTVQPQAMQHSLQALQQSLQPQIQAVQPQTVQQTVQQTIQHQTVQAQPLSAIQAHPHSQPMQIVQPQPMQTIQSHNIQQHTIQSQPVHTIQSQIQPTVQSIQSQVQSIQSQIQGQIQSQIQGQIQSQIQGQIQSQIQSQIQGQIQSQIQGQLQSLLQSQPLQTVNHSQPQVSHASQVMHTPTVQSQPVLKVQPFHKTQPPVQTVHPQPVQTIHHHPTQQTVHENQQNHPPPTSYVVNLTPDQLEQLKRNGQLTVNGQTIFMQRPNTTNKIVEHNQNNENKIVKLSPKIKPVKKVAKIQTNANIKSVLQDNLASKNVNSVEKILNHVKEKSSLITALQAPSKIAAAQPVIPTSTVQKPNIQPSAVVPPSVAVQPTVQTSVSSQTRTQKVPIQAKVQSTQTSQDHIIQNHCTTTDANNTPPEVENLLGQLLEEPATTVNAGTQSNQNHAQPAQRIHTIQLTPQQQQHLKSVQLQIQTLSGRLTPGDTEMHTALKLLFAEQQKILASGKLLPPDKVIYQNNQLTIINPSSLGIGKSEPVPPPVVQPARPSTNEVHVNHQVVQTAPAQPPPPRINTTVPATSENNVQHPNVLHSCAPTHALPIKLPPPVAPQPVVQQHPQHNKFIPSFTKAQLLEQQLNTDQNGAVKPDVHTPFRDKTDACKRLIRYHCYNQPVLSQKDLNKADEIFELTARHFIDKFSRMVDKYKFLLLKESMRQVQTSELMMLDRMFLAEEQQSLIRLRQELDEAAAAEFLPPGMNPQVPSALEQQQQEEYDEWACIQRELSCLNPSGEGIRQSMLSSNHKMSVQQVAQTHQAQPPKRSASSDSRLETLKKFRVEKHHKRGADSVQTSVNNSGFNSCNAVYSGQSGHSLQNIHCSRSAPNLSQAQRLQVTQANGASVRNTSRLASIQDGRAHYIQQPGAHLTQFTAAAQNSLQFGTHNLHHALFSGQAHQIVQHGTHPMHHSVHNVNSNQSVQSSSLSTHSSENESGNNSIDEQVQSAIDSILNLQQNSNLDLDEAVSSILS